MNRYTRSFLGFMERNKKGAWVKHVEVIAEISDLICQKDREFISRDKSLRAELRKAQKSVWSWKLVCVLSLMVIVVCSLFQHELL